MVWSRIHFPEVELQYLNRLSGKPIDVALDIGAALGHYSWVLNRKSRRIIAFEPGKVHADFLQHGLFGTNIELIRSAVGNTEGVVSMYTPGDDANALASATLSETNPVASAKNLHVDQVPVVKLDIFLEQTLSASERVDLIKIDVEGFELEVLKGGLQRIKTDLPVIIIEIESRHNDNYAQVFDLLRSIGYRTNILKAGFVEEFIGTNLAEIQRSEDLAIRIGPSYRPGASKYINNFIFTHADSKLRIFQ